MDVEEAHVERIAQYTRCRADVLAVLDAELRTNAYDEAYKMMRDVMEGDRRRTGHIEHVVLTFKRQTGVRADEMEAQARAVREVAAVFVGNTPELDAIDFRIYPRHPSWTQCTMFA